MRRRKPIKRRRMLTEDEINDRVCIAWDHAESLLKKGIWTRQEFNDFWLHLGKWAATKRQEARS